MDGEKMKDKRKKGKQKKKQRRKLLTEDEFRKLIETGKVSKKDKRLWIERSRKKCTQMHKT
jgi:hypothetical protein